MEKNVKVLGKVVGGGLVGALMSVCPFAGVVAVSVALIVKAAVDGDDDDGNSDAGDDSWDFCS